MRNIYDIISEQKAMVDVNIASYDLDYTVKQLQVNDYYLQEGVGETVKNIGRKLIEFVKKILSKIRELIAKVISFFKKSSDDVNKMEEKIAEAKAGKQSEDKKEEGKSEDKAEDKKEEGKSEDKAEDKKEEGKSEDKAEDKKEEGKSEDKKERAKEQPKLSQTKRLALQAPTVDKEKEARLKRREEERTYRQNQRDIKNDTIQASDRPTTVGHIGSKTQTGLIDAYRETKMQLKIKDYPYAGDLFKAYDNILFVVEDYVEEYINGNNKVSFNEFIASKKCKRWIDEYEKLVGGKNRLKDEYSNQMVQLISDYIYAGDRLIGRIKKVEKQTEDRINKMLNTALKNNNISDSEASMFQQAVGFIAKCCDKCSREVVEIRQYLTQLSWTVTNEYCKRLNAERRR